MIKKMWVLPLFLATLGLTGCFDGDSGRDDNDAKIGQLTVTGIEGLRYETASQRGVTDANGEYRYYEGETISFWLGNLPLASDIPAKPFLTPIDFFPDNREALRDATPDRYNLSTHTLTEERLAVEDPETINLTRLLLTMDRDKTNRLATAQDPANNIEITERVIEQFNAQLAALPETETINFSSSVPGFAALDPLSTINKVLAEICFAPAGHPDCDEPATAAEIERLQEELAQYETGSEERERVQDELQALREANRRIENARRSLDDQSPDTVETFLVRETRQINSILAREYYVTPFEFTIPASDNSIKTVTVRSHNGEPDLQSMEAISTNPEAFPVHSWSWQTREVDFYANGEPGAEGEIRIAFRPVGDYRWYQFQVRPVVPK